MSWNPYPGFHGATIDRRHAREEKYRQELNDIRKKCNPPRFEQINRLSKIYYLYWKVLYEDYPDKVHFLSFVEPYYRRIFTNYPHLVYKPAQKHLKKETSPC